MMRKIVTLGFVIAAGVVLAAQSSWTPVIITGVPGQGARTPEEKAVQEQLEASLADALVGLFPCAVPTTSADRAGEYGDAKAQQSAGAGEAESLERMRAAAGAQDVVSVKVVSMNGQFVVDVAYMDMRTGRTQARSSGQIDGSPASIDSLAGEFGAKLQKVPGFDRMKGCVAERDWAGTIGYRFGAQPTSSREKEGCKEDERSKENWNYTVRIPPAGKPSAVVAVTRLLMKESNCVRRGLWCGTAAGPVDQQRHHTETWQWIGAPRVEARVTFDEYDGKLYVSLDLPMIQTSLTVEGETKYSTPCDNSPGTPSNLQTAAPIPARVPTFTAQTVRPGQRKISGSAADGSGGTVTWRLTRTNRSR